MIELPCPVTCIILAFLGGIIAASGRLALSNEHYTTFKFLFRSISFYCYLLLVAVAGIIAMIAIEKFLSLEIYIISGPGISNQYFRAIIEGAAGRILIISGLLYQFGRCSYTVRIAEIEEKILGSISNDEKVAVNQFINKTMGNKNYTKYTDVKSRIDKDLASEKTNSKEREAFCGDLEERVSKVEGEPNKIFVALSTYLWKFGKSRFESAFEK